VILIIFISVLKNNNSEGQVLGVKTIKKPVIIIDNGLENTYLSAGESVSEIFSDLNIPVYPEDKVTVLIDPNLGLGTRIKIRRATAITVDNGGNLEYYRTWQENVRGLLDEKGITLSEIDKISPSLETTLLNNMKIKIVRVRIEQTQENVAIPFQTVHQNDPTMFYGKTKIGQNGVNGNKVITYKLTYENNILVKKEAISEKIIKQPINKIILDGTKPFSSQQGLASWTWGPTASRRYIKGTKIKITNLANGKSVITTVGGWGPQEYTGRILDLNSDCFSQIASLNQGQINVLVEEIG